MNSTSREIRRLNIKSFFNRRGVLTVAAEAAFCYLGSERLPALSTVCLFGFASLCLEVCLSFVICLNISLPFIQLLLFEQDTSVFFEAGVEAPLLVIKISQKTSPELKVLLCFKTKRSETKHKLILHENIHATRE